jgi:hypothetical protein
MHRAISLLALTLVFGLTGCNTANTRIQEHASEFAALDPTTQQKIRQGVVEPGYTPEMVYMALGRPAVVSSDTAGSTVWTYRQYPVTAYNETVQSGYLKRLVYDPVKRSSDIIIQPIDEKAFPNLVPHSLRMTFREGRLVSVERINRV